MNTPLDMLAAAEAAFLARIVATHTDRDGSSAHLTLAFTLRRKTVRLGQPPEIVGVRYAALEGGATGSRLLWYGETPEEAADGALGVLEAEARHRAQAGEET